MRRALARHARRRLRRGHVARRRLGSRGTTQAAAQRGPAVGLDVPRGEMTPRAAGEQKIMQTTTQTATAPRFEGVPAESLADETVAVRITGFAPGTRVTV